MIMNLQGKSEKEQFQYLQDNVKDWETIFPKLDEGLQIKLLKKNEDLIYNLDTDLLSEDVILTALQQNGACIAFVSNPTEKMIETALSNHPNSVRFLIEHDDAHYECETNPVTMKEEWWRMALEKDGEAIQFHPNPSEKEWGIAIASKPECIRFYKNPSEDLIFDVLKKKESTVYALEKMNIGDKTKYFKFALERKPEVIRYIEEKNPEYDWMAVETEDLSQIWSYMHKSQLLEKIHNGKNKITIEDVQKEIHYIENGKRLEVLLKGLVNVEREDGIISVIESIIDTEEKKKVFEKYRLQFLI